MLSEATSGLSCSAGCSRSSVVIVAAPPVVRLMTTSLATAICGRNSWNSAGSCDGLPSFGLRACRCTIAAPACAAPMAAFAISAGVTGRYGDMLGVWIEPVAAQVMMTFPWAAAIAALFYEIEKGVRTLFAKKGPDFECETLLPLTKRDRAPSPNSDEVAGAAADRDRLAGDVPPGRGGEVERDVGDVLRRDGGLEAHAFDHLGAHVLGRNAERLGLRRDHAVDAVALDDAGLDAVDAHLVRAGLGGEALGEADHRPLRRRVRRAHREGEPARGRGEVDDAAAARLLDERHRLVRAVEHAVEIHRDAALPVLRANVLDLGRRPGYTGVVDEHVEAAEVLLHIGEEPLDVVEPRDVGERLRNVRQLLLGAGERLLVDVANVNARPGLGKGARDDAADAGRARA